jgi:biopolymer transport protein ExbD
MRRRLFEDRVVSAATESARKSGLALNQAPVATLADLEARLRERFDARSERTLFVRAAGGVRYSRVVEALEVAKGAGAERIGPLPRSDR